MRPCCGGTCKRPGMTTQKTTGWKRYLGSWAFVLGVLQIFLLAYSIWGLGEGVDESSGWLLGPTALPLIDLGAKYTWRILEHNEWWRLLAAVNLHGGWVHITMNLSLQLRMGVQLETEWGHTRW